MEKYEKIEKTVSKLEEDYKQFAKEHKKLMKDHVKLMKMMEKENAAKTAGRPRARG